MNSLRFPGQENLWDRLPSLSSTGWPWTSAVKGCKAGPPFSPFGALGHLRRSGLAWGIWGLAMAMVGSAMAAAPRPATDEDIQKLIASAGDAKKYDNAACVFLLDEADVYVRDTGLATTESCQVIKILTDAGVQAHAVWREEFDPDTYRVTIQSIRIHRKDGTQQDVPVSSVLTQPARQSMIYWGNQQQVLGLPRLAVGDVLEVRISRTGFNIAYLGDVPPGSGAAGQPGGETLQPPMPGHWHETARFQTADPIVKKRYSVHMPQNKPLQFTVYNGPLRTSLWFDGDSHVYSFEAENVPALKQEPHMVDPDDCTPKVVLATVPDWQTKSRWFQAVNEPQFEADDAIRGKVQEITADLDDQDARIEACLHWVADNIRYYGTSRGPCEGFTLHKGIETFRDRGGVCKDIAGMLVTMLRVLGLEVYPALTMAGSRVEDIPADQFNHTVVVLRNQDGSFRILDPTWAPLSREVWSSREALQGLVYGTPEGQPLTLSPYFPPEYNLLAARSEAELAPDGTLSTRLIIDTKGYCCTYLRRNVYRQPRREQKAAFEQALRIAPNAHLDELDFTDPHDYDRDGQVKMKITAETFAAGDGALRAFRLPLLSNPLADFFIPDFDYPVDAKERKYGLRMRATRLVRYEETVRLPAGWTVDRVPDEKTLDSGSAALTFRISPGQGQITYQFELTLKNQIVPPDDYPGFKEAIEAAKALAREWVVCKVE